MALLDKLFTTNEVATLLHLSGSRIRQICIEHTLGTKPGRDRFLTAEEIDTIRTMQRPVGRPRLAVENNSNS